MARAAEIVVPPLPDTQGSTNEALVDTILSRRSIRDGFTRNPNIPSGVMNLIIQSGLTAPSSKNTQPWKIHIVGESDLDEIAGLVKYAKDADEYSPIDPLTGKQHTEFGSTVKESAHVLEQVPVGLFIENRNPFSRGRQIVEHTDKDVQSEALVGYGFEMLGIGTAIQNMWLAAHAQGVEGVFMGDVLIAEDQIRERLDMKGDLIGVLALGYTLGLPEGKAMAEGTVVDHR